MKTLKPSGNRIILIRHGETEWNRLHRFQGRSDLPLNQKGNSQARALALALRNEIIAAIYSSPPPRQPRRMLKKVRTCTVSSQQSAV